MYSPAVLLPKYKTKVFRAPRYGPVTFRTSDLVPFDFEAPTGDDKRIEKAMMLITAAWTGSEALFFGGRNEGPPLAALQRRTPQPAWYFFRKP